MQNHLMGLHNVVLLYLEKFSHSMSIDLLPPSGGNKMSLICH